MAREGPDPPLRGPIRETGVLSEDEIHAVRTQAMEQMREAVRTANAAPDADPSDLLDAVFAPA